jgi:hypothetical protein
MGTIRGEVVDRPPVSFYELNGLDENPEDKNPFNIFNHPSWKPLIELTCEKTDRIVMRDISCIVSPSEPLDDCATIESWYDSLGRLFTRTTVRAGTSTLKSLTRRDREVNTIWTVEPLLKNVDDLKAFLEIPLSSSVGKCDVSGIIQAEEALVNTGIVMIDTTDPLCEAAQLFDMANYTVIALTETRLFHQLLERYARVLYARTEVVAKALPGRLWRIYGPEYASTPYLPPRLFKELVVDYDKPMVRTIQRWGGFARLHSHGNLKKILDYIVMTGCVGLDPIEPPPQGDVELEYVRKRYGKQLVLFGNLEASDIENLPTTEFRKKVQKALHQGTMGEGRGFVLMPSACPYGRYLSPLALANYRCMIEEVEKL